MIAHIKLKQRGEEPSPASPARCQRVASTSPARRQRIASTSPALKKTRSPARQSKSPESLTQSACTPPCNALQGPRSCTPRERKPWGKAKVGFGKAIGQQIKAGCFAGKFKLLKTEVSCPEVCLASRVAMVSVWTPSASIGHLRDE